MTKALKLQIEQIIDLIIEMHNGINNALNKGDIATAVALLEECQNAAIQMGNSIETSEGEGTRAVALLEEYCEKLYCFHEELLNGRSESSDNNIEEISIILNEVEVSLTKDIHIKKEVVFLPYKASMWDSLESVWMEADANPDVEAKVIPIPYFEKNPDGTLGKMCYEGGELPQNVPIVLFDKYDFEKMHPDEIYIHNPYDDQNIVTTVHPYFYSDNLKTMTDKLIYIPYFVLQEIDPNNKEAVKGMQHFAQTKGVINADEVIVQSENMRQCYIEALVNLFGEESRTTWEKKIIGRESPKIEKLKRTTIDDIDIPEEWKRHLYKSDGTKKKVILYNTSLSAMLDSKEKMLAKMMDVFKFFEQKKDDVTLLWRPHPLLKNTIDTMLPELGGLYNQIVEYYKLSDVGIYDDTADLDRAIVLCNAYYGDHSSVVQLCKILCKPIMIQNTEVILLPIIRAMD